MKLQVSTFAIILLALITLSCTKESIPGNRNIVTQEVSIKDYSKIKLSGIATLEYEYKPGQPPYLRIEIDENIYPLLQVKTDGETLSFDSEYNLNPTEFKIYTNSSSLSKLESSGSGNVLLKGNLIGKTLEININGTSNITAENLKYDELEIEISGQSDIQLKGLISRSKYNIKGTGTVKAYELISQSVKCDIAGKGNLEVNASNELDIKIKGSAEVTYTGNPPIVKQEVFGNGKISIKE